MILLGYCKSRFSSLRVILLFSVTLVSGYLSLDFASCPQVAAPSSWDYWTFFPFFRYYLSICMRDLGIIDTLFQENKSVIWNWIDYLSDSVLLICLFKRSVCFLCFAIIVSCGIILIFVIVQVNLKLSIIMLCDFIRSVTITLRDRITLTL